MDMTRAKLLWRAFRSRQSTGSLDLLAVSLDRELQVTSRCFSVVMTGGMTYPHCSLDETQ